MILNDTFYLCYNDIVEKIHKVTFDIDFAESPFTWNNNGQKAPLMGVFWLEQIE